MSLAMTNAGRAMPGPSTTPRLRHAGLNVASRPHPAFRRSMPARSRHVVRGMFIQWEGLIQSLRDQGIDSLPPREAEQAVKSGKAVLVDVRPAKFHEQAHIPGSKNVPLFEYLTLSNLNGVGSVLKFIAMKANGVQPTVFNPEFLQGIKAAAGEDTTLILYCEAGGTMEASTSFPYGKDSRSLKAIWKVTNDSVLPSQRVQHLAGGLYGWWRDGRDVEGEYTGAEAGRTPNAVASSAGVGAADSEKPLDTREADE
ncbi:TEF4 [Auxenochlorella protothecoides x Auxenochlorella symbiontica]